MAAVRSLFISFLVFCMPLRTGSARPRKFWLFIMNSFSITSVARRISHMALYCKRCFLLFGFFEVSVRVEHSTIE